MTVHVKTINGKTLSIKCVRKQKAATISDEVERRSSIPRGMTYLVLVHQGKVMNEKKTKEENSIGAEPTIEMSLRLLGGMDESDMKATSETEEEREKKRKLEETRKSKSTRTSEESINNRRNQKIRRKDGNLLKENRRENGHISAENHGFSRNTAPWYELNHCENERRRRQIQANQ